MIRVLNYELMETAHLEYDRAERLAIIKENVGFGSPMCNYIGTTAEGKIREYIITDTGVLIVKVPNEDIAITCFLPSLMQTRRHFRNCDKKMPKWFEKLIQRNQKFVDENH